MDALLDSRGEIGTFSVSCDSGSGEATLAEDVRVFRVGIAQWAARYVAQHDLMEAEAGDECRKASANLQSWSREYFRGTKGLVVHGATP
jgi:hypothetical protein